MSKITAAQCLTAFEMLEGETMDKVDKVATHLGTDTKVVLKALKRGMGPNRFSSTFPDMPLRAYSRKEIPVEDVITALNKCKSTKAAAQDLGCSPNVLKRHIAEYKIIATWHQAETA